MFKDFVGKNVEMILGFASYTIDGGASPAFYYGEVVEVNDSSLKILLSQQGSGSFGTKKYDNELMEVNLKYIISLREML